MYAKKNQIENVEKVFISVPKFLGQKFKYTSIDNTTKSQSINNALTLLNKAGIVYKCYHTIGQGVPLGANRNEKRFKAYFFDIGLAQRILGLNLKEWVLTPIDKQYIGAIAKQFIAQEYIAYASPESPCQLYYWHREEKSSNAEVDFLFVKDNQVVPVEVKSGVKGGMKSIHAFLDSHPNTSYGLKISQGAHAKQALIQDIPLYALEGWLKATTD